MPGIGVIANIVTVLVGSAVGLAFGRLIPERMRQTTFRAIGLAVLVIGFAGALGGLTDLSAAEGALGKYAALVFVISLVAGSIIGEALRIEYWFERWGEALQSATARLPWLIPVAEVPAGVEPAAKTGAEADADPEAIAEAKSHTIVDGFVTATLIFCVGAMTVVGSIQDGLGNPDTLYLKALLDGIAAIALASTLGWGVALSIIPIAIMQGGLALLAALFGGNVTPETLSAIDAVGGALIVAIGLDLTGIKRLPFGNMLPAVFVAAVLAAVLS